MQRHNRLIIPALIVTGLLAVLWLRTPPDQALADAAPPPPPSGSVIFPSIGNTNVQMVSEVVIIDISQEHQYLGGYADVVASFTMRNLGEVDEHMRVRFPMFHTDYEMDFELENLTDYCGYSPYPALSDFKAYVDGQEMPVDLNIQTLVDHLRSPTAQGEDVLVTVPCWAYFDAYFPAFQDVIIEITYRVPGYIYTQSWLRYSYVLQTGAGWRDNIGHALIVVQLPFKGDELFVADCTPDNCSVLSQSVVWEFYDFEPVENIEITLVKPEIWYRVVKEKALLDANPENGEAWGRLAKAYKDANRDYKYGVFRDSPLYTLSVEAYQNAVAFLPGDADWQFGYADLLCTNLLQYGWFYDQNYFILVPCLKQIEQTLHVNPVHEQTRAMLDDLIAVVPFPIVDLTGARPVFLDISSHEPVLPTSTSTPTWTQSKTPTFTPTSSPTITIPRARVLPTHTSTPVGTAIAESPQAEQSTEPDFNWTSLGVYFVLVLGIGAWVISRRK